MVPGVDPVVNDVMCPVIPSVSSVHHMLPSLPVVPSLQEALDVLAGTQTPASGSLAVGAAVGGDGSAGGQNRGTRFFSGSLRKPMLRDDVRLQYPMHFFDSSFSQTVDVSLS